MSVDIIRQNSFFELYTKGNKNSLLEIYAHEKTAIFDFILRMTGEQESALKTIEHLEKIINNSQYQWRSLSELRTSIYLKAKKTNETKWGLDTSHILNPFFEHQRKSLHKNKKTLPKNQESYINLEKIIGSCAALGREILLLHIRCRFSFSEIQEFNNLSYKEVEEFFFLTLDFLKQKEPKLPRNPKKIITMIDEYPLPKSNKDTVFSFKNFFS